MPGAGSPEQQRKGKRHGRGGVVLVSVSPELPRLNRKSQSGGGEREVR